MSRVIDADGHVLETDSEIYEHLEPPFSGDPAILKFPFFPSLDGFHRVARRLATVQNAPAPVTPSPHSDYSPGGR
jgi:hypothetical protein